MPFAKTIPGFMYCVAFLAIYLWLAIRNYRRTHRWTHNVVNYLGLAICFVFYLGNHMIIGLVVGFLSIGISIYFDNQNNLRQRRNFNRKLKSLREKEQDDNDRYFKR